jgi:hypothetical protein
MLDIWSVKSGHSLGTFEERSNVNITLPITSNIPSINYSVISGKLPPGLRLKNNLVLGTPLEVVRPTTFDFCVRAQQNKEITDRTFRITITGSDEPVVLTDPGLLPVGPNETYFVLDSTPIDFQLEVTDTDTAAGQRLRFFIASGDGELPPGTTLSDKGRISGFIDPLLAINLSEQNGNYDSQGYDTVAFDYGLVSDNGFDSFGFDSITFDYSAPVKGLRKLNRNYEFIVTITDGDTVIRRKFRIYVVGEDYLRADNTIMRVGTGSYLASSSSLKTPIWRTSPNLGLVRCNNYQIIKLDIYNTVDIGPIQYYLNPLNPDETPSVLPPGLKLDIKSGELFGLLPYQPEVTKTYHFTVTVTRFGNDNETAAVPRTFTLTILGQIDSTLNWISPSDLGSIAANYTSTLKIEASSTLNNAIIRYQILEGQLPPGLELTSSGEIVGRVQQYTSLNNPGITTFYDVDLGERISNQTFDGGETTIDKSYRFIVRALDQFNYSAIDREFVLDINIPNDRLYSNIYTISYMNFDKRKLFKDFILNENVFPQKNIYRITDPNFGLRTDMRMLVYAGIETVDAGEYISIIGLNHERKRFLFGDIKTAKATIPGTNQVVYEIIYVDIIDPLDKKDQHLPLETRKPSKVNSVITADASNYIWKGQDQYSYVNKREIMTARPLESITIDRTNLLASDPQSSKRYPNTITNWRRRIRYHELLNGRTIASERNYLPLWMTSFQANKEELGFVLAMPLCYCKPNMSEEITLNIKNYLESTNFNFNYLDYVVDRYIIDSVNEYGNDKYLVFKNQGVTV